jgi:hypothetical protein
MDGLRHAIHGAYVKVAEAALAPLSQSKFDEKRVRGFLSLNRVLSPCYLP